MARLPGIRTGLRPGKRVYATFCEDCGMPVCPHCGSCCDPVWVLELGFQCGCGWSGVLDGNELGAEALAALRGLWAGVQGDAGIII